MVDKVNNNYAKVDLKSLQLQNKEPPLLSQAVNSGLTQYSELKGNNYGRIGSVGIYLWFDSA